MAFTYKLGFEADTSKVSSAIKTIESDLKKLDIINIGAKSFSEATSAARTLESALSKAATTGGISYSKLDAELKKTGKDAATLMSTLSATGMNKSVSAMI